VSCSAGLLVLLHSNMPFICHLGQLISHVGLGDTVERNIGEEDIQRSEIRRRRFWRSAEEILEANYLRKVGLVRTCSDSFTVRGICLQVSHPDDRHQPFIINITFSKVDDDDNEISGGQCSCLAGSLARCKHAVALLLHLTKLVHNYLLRLV